MQLIGLRCILKVGSEDKDIKELAELEELIDMLL